MKSRNALLSGFVGTKSLPHGSANPIVNSLTTTKAYTDLPRRLSSVTHPKTLLRPDSTTEGPGRFGGCSISSSSWKPIRLARAGISGAMSMQEILHVAKAREYLAEQLAQGTTLARRVLQRTDFSQGRYRAGMPDGVDQAEINFHWSIRGRRGEERAFARIMKTFIEEVGGAGLVADTETRNSQEDLDGYPYRDRMVTYGDEVHWRIAGAGLSEDDIMNLLGAPVLPYPLCVFLHLANSADTKTDLSHAHLRQIVRRLIGVAVAAFDTDSFLLWWRDDLVPFSSVAAS